MLAYGLCQRFALPYRTARLVKYGPDTIDSQQLTAEEGQGVVAQIMAEVKVMPTSTSCHKALAVNEYGAAKQGPTSTSGDAPRLVRYRWPFLHEMRKDDNYNEPGASTSNAKLWTARLAYVDGWAHEKPFDDDWALCVR